MFNLGMGEILVVAIVAILVFGRNLPRVAGEAASVVQRLRRSLQDLRRETGIDQELRDLRRKVDQEITAPARQLDVGRQVRGEIANVSRELRQAAAAATATMPEQTPPAALPPSPALPPAPESAGTPPPAARSEVDPSAPPV
jgi:sec-independent protein translocase protein TatA